LECVVFSESLRHLTAIHKKWKQKTQKTLSHMQRRRMLSPEQGSAIHMKAGDPLRRTAHPACVFGQTEVSIAQHTATPVAVITSLPYKIGLPYT